MLTFSVGDMEPSELNLVFSSWLKSHWFAKDAKAPDKLYWNRQHDLIQDTLEELPLLLAARSEGVVLGWLCARPTDDAIVVDYVYVKSVYRRYGVANKLLREALYRLNDVSGEGLSYSHRPGPRFQWVATKLDEHGFDYVPTRMRVRRTA